MSNEVWKDIENLEGQYQVSNLGRVKSLERVITRSNGWPLRIKEKILKQHDNGKGYMLVKMDKRFVAVHRIVAKHFLDNPQNLPEVDHIDGRRGNNESTNLEWVTKSENMKRSHARGARVCPDIKGDKNPGSKLTEREVIEIRKRHKEGAKQVEIAKDFGINFRTVSQIVNRSIWKHVK